MEAEPVEYPCVYVKGWTPNDDQIRAGLTLGFLRLNACNVCPGSQEVPAEHGFCPCAACNGGRE